MSVESDSTGELTFEAAVIEHGGSSGREDHITGAHHLSNSATRTSSSSGTNNVRRGAIKAATRSFVESDRRSRCSKEAIRPKHFVKIIVDDDEVTHVSMEQVERVKQMHSRIEEGASFSFNYNTMLVVASIVAGLGLVSNSSTNVIASMLVSPLMGPVVGLAYGSTIRDWKLVRRSLKVELVSILICIIIGVIVAGCTSFTELADDWPTQEMQARRDMTNFYVALPVAFFSGLGVAVSLLDDQTSSLVGVAISASLLPPSVNAGVLWAAYLLNKLEENVQDGFEWEDRRSMGTISLGITIANVILIWISSMIMFRMKEVLPIEKKVFWTDLGVARKIYQNRAVLVDTDSHTATEDPGIVDTV